MKRRHAITPTASAPKPNPLWERAKPTWEDWPNPDGTKTRVLMVDAMVAEELRAHYEANKIPPADG